MPDNTRIEEALKEVLGLGNGIDQAQETENARLVEQERESTDSTLETFPCPDILWQGLFGQIADRLEKRSWEIWMGTLGAMGATAHKNLHWHYHRPLFGMVYGLLISPTGQGKGIVADTCTALLPEHYTFRDSVQSGPALFPILAKIERDTKGKLVSISPRPAILIIEEWTTLVKSSKIEFSNLQDSLNTLFHRQRAWNVSRSDTEKSGGDREVDNPILSICATTTESLLQEHVTPSMIRSGFLNRYFVVPGSSGSDWDFYDPKGAGIDANRVKGFLDHLVAHAWGAGANVWDSYEPEAKERLIIWGRQTFNPLMRSSSLEAESLKRLHTYSHIIALLYAWSSQTKLVQLSHVEAAIAATAISKAFVEKLIQTNEVETPKFKRYEASIEQKVTAYVTKNPGCSPRQGIASLHSKNITSSDISRTIQQLVQTGTLRLKNKGKQKSLYLEDLEDNNGTKRSVG